METIRYLIFSALFILFSFENFAATLNWTGVATTAPICKNTGAMCWCGDIICPDFDISLTPAETADIWELEIKVYENGIYVGASTILPFNTFGDSIQYTGVYQFDNSITPLGDFYFMHDLEVILLQNGAPVGLYLLTVSPDFITTPPNPAFNLNGLQPPGFPTPYIVCPGQAVIMDPAPSIETKSYRVFVTRTDNLGNPLTGPLAYVDSTIFDYYYVNATYNITTLPGFPNSYNAYYKIDLKGYGCDYTEVTKTALLQYRNSIHCHQIIISNHPGPVEHAVLDDWAKLRVAPNPFRDVTSLSFTLEPEQYVSLRIWNTYGEIVEEILSNKFLPAGEHRFEFYAEGLEPGIYFGELQTDQGVDIVQIFKE